MDSNFFLAVQYGSLKEIEYFLQHLNKSPNTNLAGLPISCTDGTEIRAVDYRHESIFTIFHFCILDCFMKRIPVKLGILELLLKHSADVAIPVKGIRIHGSALRVWTFENATPMEFLFGLKRHQWSSHPTSHISKVLMEAAASAQNQKNNLPQAPSALMKRLIKTPSLSDVVFVCSDHHGNELRAQKCILAAASPYFETYFQGPWGQEDKHKDGRWETNNSTVAMKAVLSFIYTGDPELTLDITEDLEQLKDILKVAHEYGLPDLVNTCGANCTSLLKPENVFGMLQLAYNHDATYLKAACESFIKNMNSAEFDIAFNPNANEQD